MIEKAVAKQLCDYLKNNDLFEDFQSGFRTHHSTETALVKFTNDLLASDKGLVSILVLLYLSAAFDTIDHDILLQRLEHLVDIKGTALGWFRSYLSECSQLVCEPWSATGLSAWTYFVHIIYASVWQYYKESFCTFSLLCG